MGRNSSALLLTDDVALPLDAILSAVRDAGAEAVPEDDVVVITQCESLEGKLPIMTASFDVVVTAWNKPELVGEHWLREIGRVLKPGGELILQSILSSGMLEKPSSTMELKLLMQGFLDVQSLEMKPFSSAGNVQSITIKGKKASWTAGSSFPLKKATSMVPKIKIDDESDLIDEDSLLTEEDRKKPQLPAFGDCEVGSTRKACKNCTCGRAQEEEKLQKVGLTTEQMNNPQSACGSCGLGDAFRCGGCPYRGLPPFKLGEKVSLPGNFLVADI